MKTNKPILQILILGVALLIWFGCDSDNPAVTEKAPTDNSTTAVATGSLTEQVEGKEENHAAQIRGVLVDGVAKQALGGVRVQLINEAGDVRKAVTTATGVFEFKNVPSGQHFTLIVNHDGFEKQEVTIGPMSSGETGKFELGLVPIAVDLLPEGEGLEIGTKAPNFSLPDVKGKVRSLDDYTGKHKVVLAFHRGSW